MPDVLKCLHNRVIFPLDRPYSFRLGYNAPNEVLLQLRVSPFEGSIGFRTTSDDRSFGIVWRDQTGQPIDLGCGTGSNCIYLAINGFDVTGVDCSAAAIHKARAKADR